MNVDSTDEKRKRQFFWLLIVVFGTVGIGLSVFDKGWIAWAFCFLSLSLHWWRVALPVAGALATSWSLATFTSMNSGWTSWSLLAIALVGGVLWHRAKRRPMALDTAT